MHWLVAHYGRGALISTEGDISGNFLPRCSTHFHRPPTPSPLSPSYLSPVAALWECRTQISSPVPSNHTQHGNRNMPARPTYAPISPQDGDGDGSNSNPGQGFVSVFYRIGQVFERFPRTVGFLTFALFVFGYTRVDVGVLAFVPPCPLL